MGCCRYLELLLFIPGGSNVTFDIDVISFMAFKRDPRQLDKMSLQECVYNI